MSEVPDEYQIAWATPAHRALGRLPEKVATAAVEFVYGSLCRSPHRLGHPLRWELKGRYSARRGDHRIIYRIDEDRRLVVVETIEHRADAYRTR